MTALRTVADLRDPTKLSEHEGSQLAVSGSIPVSVNAYSKCQFDVAVTSAFTGGQALSNVRHVEFAAVNCPLIHRVLYVGYGSQSCH